MNQLIGVLVHEKLTIKSRFAHFLKTNPPKNRDSL